MNDAIEFLADVGHTIIAGRKFAKFHLTMVFVAKRTDVGSVCYSGHEETSSCYLKAQVNTRGREMRDPGKYLTRSNRKGN